MKLGVFKGPAINSILATEYGAYSPVGIGRRSSSSQPSMFSGRSPALFSHSLILVYPRLLHRNSYVFMCLIRPRSSAHKAFTAAVRRSRNLNFFYCNPWLLFWLSRPYQLLQPCLDSWLPWIRFPIFSPFPQPRLDYLNCENYIDGKNEIQLPSEPRFLQSLFWRQVAWPDTCLIFSLRFRSLRWALIFILIFIVVILDYSVIDLIGESDIGPRDYLPFEKPGRETGFKYCRRSLSIGVSDKCICSSLAGWFLVKSCVARLCNLF